MSSAEEQKRRAGERAAELVQSGMRVGLGTGSTAIWAVRRLAERLASGDLREVVGFATSQATAAEARALGLPLMDEAMPAPLDLTIDGADEIDEELNLIKGGGGALLREKIAAQASARLVIVADLSKLAPQLGTRWAVPVEVLPVGWQSQARFLAALGANVQVRGGAATPTLTDSGNLILDANFGPIDDPAALAAHLATRAGIIEHGLFLRMCHHLIIAGADGISERFAREERS